MTSQTGESNDNTYLVPGASFRYKKKAKKRSYFFKSTLGTRLITIQILPNITRSKINQTIKFGQLIE